MPFLVTLALVIGTALTSVGIGLNLAAPMVLLTAAWVAWDSRRIGARHFQSWLAHGPGLLFMVVSVAWIAAFPGYLMLRERVLSGTAEPKPGLSSDEVRRLVLAALR